MINKRGWVFNLILIILIILLASFGGYYIYQNTPGNPENLSFSVENNSVNTESLNLTGVSQFYPNMKFNHKLISYSIDSACSEKKRQRMISAFNELSSKVTSISFYETEENPDIEISCSEEKKESVDEDFFIAGEGGAKEIVQTERYNIITNGTVLLYKEIKSEECEWSNVELHELIHVFGFGHSNNSNSLMYPYLEDCDQRLDDSIINELIRIYSEENLAELYFYQLSAVKKGRYLDFNLTIKNSGAINSGNTTISVLNDGELVEDFGLNEITFGAGISIEIKNLKLTSRDPKEIRFIIDRENLVKEVDEANNLAIVSPEGE
ncbi:MAG: CARDB domain-containing protein [Candidatus Pacearchaeota archaeon]|jgi:hypothetical protein